MERGFFCCIGSFHSAEMKIYIDTHRYRYVSTISCNKKIEQKYGVRFAHKDMPIFFTNINEGRTGAKCGFAIGITSTNSLW